MPMTENPDQTKDTSEAYDARQGKTTDAVEQKPSGLSEAGNQPPPHPVPFKNLKR